MRWKFPRERPRARERLSKVKRPSTSGRRGNSPARSLSGKLGRKIAATVCTHTCILAYKFVMDDRARVGGSGEYRSEAHFASSAKSLLSYPSTTGNLAPAWKLFLTLIVRACGVFFLQNIPTSSEWNSNRKMLPPAIPYFKRKLVPKECRVLDEKE